MIDEKQLQEWRKLADEATPGPWYLYDGYINRLKAYCVRIGTPDFTVLSAAGRIADLEAAQIDFEFIALSRSVIPALLEEVARLNARVAELEARDDSDKRYAANCPNCGAPMRVIRPGDARCSKECYIKDGEE